jgi:hypothetical protein
MGIVFLPILNADYVLKFCPVFVVMLFCLLVRFEIQASRDHE